MNTLLTSKLKASGPTTPSCVVFALWDSASEEEPHVDFFPEVQAAGACGPFLIAAPSVIPAGE